MLVNLVSGLALVLALFSAWFSWTRSRIPPQLKAFYDLQSRVEALEFRAQQISETITREQRRQLAADARDAKASKKNSNEVLAQEALALLHAPPATPATPAKSPEEERAAYKAQLRQRANLSRNL